MQRNKKQTNPASGASRIRLPGRPGHMLKMAAWTVPACCLFPAQAWAIQLHQGREGIIVHQVGHVFFLLSMVVLVFIITGRHLNRLKGWRMIQYSAILFVLWNLDTVTAHFFDNQIRAVTVENLSLWQVKISAVSGSELLVLIYHSLKLDHLLCVPAIFLFYRGLSSLLAQEKYRRKRDVRDASPQDVPEQPGRIQAGDP